jgi:hypothetical protein
MTERLFGRATSPMLFALYAIALVSVLFIASNIDPQPTRAATGEVVMLDTTDVGFGAGTLASSFVAAGKTVVYKTPTDWAAMTAAEFAAYDAVVLADPTCQTGTAAITAAIGNAATWGSVVDGNVIIIGTDEQYHNGTGGQTLMNGAAPFTVAEPGKTGAYISLSCYYHGAAPSTPLPMLDAAFGSTGDFTTTGVPGCFDSAHIVATHPAFTSAGVTDATLSGWGCSVHEAFDAWPVGFEVLAIALTGTAYNAPDGTIGTPYILARGVEVISDIDLSPDGAVNPVGTSHSLTATVTTDDPTPGTPIEGTDVTFEVISGPHTGTTGVDATDGSGIATFSYTGTAVGIDTIEGTFIDALGRTQRSNRVTKEWIEGPPPPPSGGLVKITGGGAVPTGEKNHGHSFGFNMIPTADGSSLDVNLEYNDNHFGKASGKKGQPSPLQIHINDVATSVTVIATDADGNAIGVEIEAACEIRNLEPGNVRSDELCRVRVVDNGEPGKGVDVFQLDSPSTGYGSNIVGSDLIEKGNIQAHVDDD